MIARRIYELAARQPERPALVHGATEFSYAAMAGNIEVVRGFFEGWTRPIGGTAVIIAENFAHAWFLSLGLRALGLETICVQSVESAEALRIGSLAMVVMTRADQTTLDALARLARGAPSFVFPTERFDVKAPATPPVWREPPRYGGCILYTSGTTGLYKKVLMDGALEEARNRRWSENLQVNAASVYHNLYLPPWTAVGFDFPTCVWNEGGCVIIDQRTDLFRRFGERDCDLVFVNAAMLAQLLDGRAEDAPRMNVRLIVGGGPLTQAMAERSRASLTDHITAIYGATEHHNCLLSELREGGEAIWLTPAVDGVFDVVDEAGGVCAADVEGSLRIRLTAADPTGYLDDADATARFFRDGCFYPGDLAVRDPGGRIRILGRNGDVLNFQGTKIAVAPLEQRIQQQLGVDYVCLFGIVGEDGGEELIVAIEATRAIERSELTQIAREHPGFQRVHFHMLAAFPRTEGGMRKIDRAGLRAMVTGRAKAPSES